MTEAGSQDVALIRHTLGHTSPSLTTVLGVELVQRASK